MFKVVVVLDVYYVIDRQEVDEESSGGFTRRRRSAADRRRASSQPSRQPKTCFPCATRSVASAWQSQQWARASCSPQTRATRLVTKTPSSARGAGARCGRGGDRRYGLVTETHCCHASREQGQGEWVAKGRGSTWARGRQRRRRQRQPLRQTTIQPRKQPERQKPLRYPRWRSD